MPRLTIATRLFVATGTLRDIVGHLRHLNGLPDLDDTAFAYGQDHIRSVFARFSETFQSAVDAVSAMLNEFDALRSDEWSQRPHLVVAVQALGVLLKAIPEDLRAAGLVATTLQAFIGWDDTLEKIHHYAFVAYSAWVADTLDQQATASGGPSHLATS